LMCVEGLSAMLNNFTMGYVDRGYQVCRRAPWITHSLFAGDSSLRPRHKELQDYMLLCICIMKLRVSWLIDQKALSFLVLEFIKIKGFFQRGYGY
jgi:hypothetical protein